MYLELYLSGLISRLLTLVVLVLQGEPLCVLLAIYKLLQAKVEFGELLVFADEDLVEET